MKAAEEGKAFLIADVEIKNIGEYQWFFSRKDFSATDKEGNLYNTELNYSEDSIEELTKLYTNEKLSGKVFFEVMENAEDLKIIHNFGDFHNFVRHYHVKDRFF